MNAIPVLNARLQACLILVTLLLVTACGTTNEVKDIVAESNAALLLDEVAQMTVEVESPGLVGRGEGARAVDDQAAASIVSRIDSFIENHPGMPATLNALRIRKAMLHLNRKEWNLARAAFESFDPTIPGNTRDLALYDAREALVFWWPVAPESDISNLPGDALFARHTSNLADIVSRQPKGSSVRLLLAYLHSHMTIKRAMLMDEQPGAQALIDAYRSLLSEFDSQTRSGITALFSPSSTAEDLAKLPEAQIRFLLQLPALRDFYTRTYQRVSGQPSHTPIETLAPWIPETPQ